MPITTANGLPATAVRGVPNAWIVRVSRLTYWAIETDGTDIRAVDTDNIAHDTCWSIPGEVGRTFVRDYDTVEDGRDQAGWHVMFNQNHAEPHRTAGEALSQLKLQMRSNHAKRQDCVAAAKQQKPRGEQEMQQAEVKTITKETETMSGCLCHNRADERGEFADRLPVPACDTRLRHGYGIWSDGAGGIVYVGHCALDVANFAAAELAEDPDDEVRIVVMCDDHEEQPADGCEVCFNEYDED